MTMTTMTIYSAAEAVPASLKLENVSLLTRTAPAVAGRLPGQVSSLLTLALDTLEDGLILTNPGSRVLYANRAARAALLPGPLAVRNGLLCAATAAETQDLQRVIAGRVRHAERSAFIRLTASGGRRPLLLTVTTAEDAGADGLTDDPTVLVLIRDGRRAAAPSPEMVGTFFDLTPAESRLACEMIKGDGLKACAKRLGITPNTARTHLNRVFDKTGTNRQAELVRLLLSCRCAVGLGRSERAS